MATKLRRNVVRDGSKTVLTICAVVATFGLSSTVVGADELRPAHRHRAPQLTDKDVIVNASNAGTRTGKQTDHARKAVNSSGVRTALQQARFGEALAGSLSDRARSFDEYAPDKELTDGEFWSIARM